jgi:hypothetical protein
VTAGFIYLQPESYQAQATVIVPALSVKGYSTSAVTQYVSSYKDVLTSAPVVAQVSQETGVSKKDLVAGLSATTITSSSNVILVTYTGSKKSEVQPVVQAAAIDSLDILLGPQLQKAQLEEAATKSALNDANAALNKFASDSGHLFPDVDYKIASSVLSALEVQRTQSFIAHDKARVKFLDAIIATRKADLLALAPKVTQFQSLLQARSGAESVHTKALSDLYSVQAEIASDKAPGSVIVTFLGHVSRTPLMLRFGGVAAAVALLLALGLIILMEFLRPTGSTTAAYGSPVAVPRSLSGVKVPGASAVGALTRSARARGPGGAPGAPDAPAPPSNGSQ